MKCLIIAAGQGSRLKEISKSKPLTSVLGVPLIERVIRSAIEGGVDDFVIVTGYYAVIIDHFLIELAKKLGVKLTLLHNEKWEKENGFSVLKAKASLSEPFLLMMADHLIDPKTIQQIQQQPIKDDTVILSVDKNMGNPMVDINDVTKVLVEDNHVKDIGKQIESYNAYDTGLFYCTLAIFRALETTCKIKKNTSLSAAVRMLADEKKVVSFESASNWVDIDDELSLHKAEKLILESVKGKQNDGPIARWLNRPLSIRVSKSLLKTDITPNQISMVSFLVSVIAAGLFAVGGYVPLAFGGILAQVASVIDGCDGEVARIKYLSSEYGGWFDAVLDRYADAFLLFGLTWHVLHIHMTQFVLVIGFMAIIGSFMLSYTADKYDRIMKNQINRKGIRIGRDIRVFIIFSGAVLNLPLLCIVVIAISMNMATVHRIVICRNEK